MTALCARRIFFWGSFVLDVGVANGSAISLRAMLQTGDATRCHSDVLTDVGIWIAGLRDYRRSSTNEVSVPRS